MRFMAIQATSIRYGFMDFPLFHPGLQILVAAKAKILILIEQQFLDLRHMRLVAEHALSFPYGSMRTEDVLLIFQTGMAGVTKGIHLELQQLRIRRGMGQVAGITGPFHEWLMADGILLVLEKLLMTFFAKLRLGQFQQLRIGRRMRLMAVIAFPIRDRAMDAGVLAPGRNLGMAFAAERPLGSLGQLLIL